MRTLSLCTLLLSACAADLDDTTDDTGEEVETGSIETVQESDGTYTSVIDATGSSLWVHLDLDSGAMVTEAEGWDLAFKRFEVKSNGGVSGDGGVEAAELAGQDFDALSTAPTEGWVSDADGAEGIEYALGGWYNYNPEDHSVTPFDITYAVSSDEGAPFKVRFIDYYDDAGTSGMITLRWGGLAPAAR